MTIYPAEFQPLCKTLQTIQDESSFKTAHQQIKTKIKEMSQGDIFSVVFQKPLEISDAEKFFHSVMVLKAKQANLFVPNIVTCSIKKDTPLGFVRTVTMQHNPTQETDEQVWMNLNTRKILFLMLDHLFIATNELKIKDGKAFFIARYIMQGNPNLTADSFTEKMENVFKTMQAYKIT